MVHILGELRYTSNAARYAEAFDMNVWWWGSQDGRERAAIDGATVAPSRESFFAESDVVSVHIRLKPSTRSAIMSADLDSMRPDSLFVNTSRAGVIEAGALEAALIGGRPGYAAVDVFRTEPVTDVDHPFIRHPNLIATPHIGYVTEDEWDLQFTTIYDQINAYAAGRPIHMINPDVWHHPTHRA